VSIKTKKYTQVFILPFFVVIFILLMSEKIQAEGQGWFSNSLNLTINNEFSLILKSQIRSHNISFQDPFVYFLEGGAGYKLSTNFYLATYYRRQTAESEDHLVNENRYILETGWKKKLNRSFSFDWRFRTERRSFEHNEDVNHFRFRLYIRFTTNIKLGTLKLKPFVAEEPFWDTKIDDFSQNRFYLGTVVPLSEKVEYVLSYLRQDLKNKKPNHILYTGFNLRF
jgi:hypothetical protein